MLFSKIWFVVLAVAAAFAVGTAFVVPKPAQREIHNAYAASLDRTQHNADLMLRMGARDWIDAVTSMTRDRVLVEVLEQANDRREQIQQFKERATGRVLSLTSDLAADRRPELIIAVDARGKQVAHVGPGESKFTAGKDGLIGYPLVEAALRGYRLDDSWSLDGKLYMMVAAPVISRARGRYVGALVLGRLLDNRFAQHLRGRLGGADLIFFLRGNVVASTLNSGELARLPLQFVQRRAQIEKDGRSTAVAVGEGEQAQMVIMAPVPGEAAHHDAFYAVIGPATPALAPGRLLSMVRGQDLAWAHFPWLLLTGGLIVVLVVGIGLMLWELDLPMHQLFTGAGELAKGELSRMNDRQFKGRFAVLARHINAALERAERRGIPPSSTKDLGKPRAPAAEAPPKPELRLDPAFASMPPIASDTAHLVSTEPMFDLPPASASPTGAMRASGNLEIELEEVRAPAIAQELPATVRRTPAEGLPAVSRSTISRPAEGLPSSARSMMAGPGGYAQLEPLSGEAASSFGLEPTFGAAMPEEPGAASAVHIPPSEALASAGDLPLLPPLEDYGSEELPASEDEPATAAEEQAPPAAQEERELAEYFKQVFDSFLAIKRQCGESTSSLTLERFEEKLKQNRQSLIARYKCKSVKFQVYIKDGKAAIKATPVKD